ncbi:AraC-type transcriptional regulator N-terminus [Chitinophaga jiangningensis]|uniref:AraC-type transcriptional regulator N-terminus n=1 Tax=Chitinophaga jiangningensis TaxID=1419482 RepID=A0A1M6VWV4_9BACT|nr:AraC family transcriptional regulator [Chitinophaga jiangningensis]SHK85939.1 AraC-type transcriptional regulator N-terminus [Chitinophaga jiangningensis]
MLLKFPQDFPGQQLLKLGNTHYAMLKQRRMAEKRRVFLKENTLIFVLNGYKILHTNDTSIEVAAGSVFILRKGFHILSDIVEDGTDFKSLLIYFTDEQVSRFIHKYGAHFPATGSPVANLVIPITTALNSFQEQYLQYFTAPPATIGELLPLKVFELLLLLLATPQKTQVAAMLHDIANGSAPNIDWVVKHHLFEPLTLPELARLSNRSLAAFKRDFQQHFQSSPRQWITAERLKYAHTLLLNSQLQITEISLECGFEHTPHFISLFRKQYGTTPQAMRTKNVMI